MFVNGSHPAGYYHAFAVAGNGSRFLIPQFDTLGNLYSSGTIGRGRGATLNAIVPSVVADRRSSGAFSNSMTPITVVLNWMPVTGQ